MVDLARRRGSVKRRHLETMYRLAELSYPYECCGVIVTHQGEEGVIEKIHSCPNIADKLHAMNPEEYRRDARTSYVLGGKTWLAIFQRVSDGEIALKAIYHSHVDAEPYFSAEDRARALALEDPPQPLFPEVFYIVLSVEGGRISRVTPYRAFQWSQEEQDFVQFDLGIEN